MANFENEFGFDMRQITPGVVLEVLNRTDGTTRLAAVRSFNGPLGAAWVAGEGLCVFSAFNVKRIVHEPNPLRFVGSDRDSLG